MQYITIFAVLLLSAVSGFSFDANQLNAQLAASGPLSCAQYSVYAKYVDGPVIVDINSSQRLSPASTLKLYTTAAALDILGADLRFETKIYYSGIKKGSKINGDIYIKGGGDPTLGSNRMPGTPGLEELIKGWVEQIKSNGIEKINGSVFADNSMFSGVLLPWRTSYQNIGNYFAAPVDALSIRDNSYDIYFEPSSSDGEKAKIQRTDPEIPGLNINSHVKVSTETKGDNAYVNFVPGSKEIEIYGTIPASDKPLKISAAMPNPALFLAQYLKAKLIEAGIEVEGGFAVMKPDTYEDKVLLLTQQSPTVEEIIKYTNKRSFNLYADSLLRSLSSATGGTGRSGEGILQMENYLKRMNIDAANFNVFDGSGISRDDITDCKTTVALLEAVLKQPYKDAFINSLPVAGDPEDIGNMSRRLRRSSAAYNALIKTGSLDRARAHAGYTKDSKGRDIALCIVSNNFNGTLREVDAYHEGIINALSDIGLNKRPKAAKSR